MKPPLKGRESCHSQYFLNRKTERTPRDVLSVPLFYRHSGFTHHIQTKARSRSTGCSLLQLPAFGLLLFAPKRSIATVTLQKLGMRALFNNAAILKDDDVVGIHDGGQTMSDHNDGFLSNK